MTTAILEYLKDGAGSCRNESAILELRKAVEDALDWLEHAPISYANGNTHGWMDEGDVLGGRHHEKLTAQLRAALNPADKPDDEETIAEQLAEQLVATTYERNEARIEAQRWKTRFDTLKAALRELAA